MNVLLEAAASYARQRWPVLPLHSVVDGRCSCGKAACASPGKHPRTPNGLKDASLDAEVLDTWWGQWPLASPGVRTGPRPEGAGIWVLDLDAGTDALARVEAAAAAAGDPGGATWATLTARTGGGGLHLVYRFAAPDVEALAELGLTLPTRNGIGGKGLDVRAEGGYVVAAPSLHESGRRYAWEDQRDMIPAPRWLLQLVGKPVEARKTYTPPPRTARSSSPTTDEVRARYGAAVLTNACRRVAAAIDGDRHNELLRQAKTVGGYVVSGRIPYAEALDALCAAGQSTGKGPKECRRTATDGLTHGMERPLEVPEREEGPSQSSSSSSAPGADTHQPGADGQQSQSSSDPKADRLAETRALLARCLGVLYADSVSRADRQAVARELAGCVDMLADLAIAVPDEWATWCAAAGAAGGFSEQLVSLRRAVTAAVDAWKAAKRKAANDKRAEQSDKVRAKIMESLSMSATGKVSSCYANIITVLKRDPTWEKLRMSTLGSAIQLDGEELAEAPGTASCCEWLRDAYGIEAAESSVKSAICAVAQERLFSPVKEYLEGVRKTWGPSDPSVIARLLPEVLGIVDATDLQRAMIGRFLVGAVARAMRPGCKLDTALVLVGTQGAKKSTFFSEIFGQFFGDSPIPIGSKDAPIMMSRVWGFEAAELEDLTSKRSAESVKQFMGTARDLYRAPFARLATLNPRHTVLCGSINPTGGRGGAAAFLTDSSGSRRFWVLTVPRDWVIPIALLRDLRDSIWAEALALYEQGEKWWFDRAEDLVREEDAQQYTEEDVWQAKVVDWLSKGPSLMGDFQLSEVLSGIGLETSQQNRAASVRVRVVLVRLGWTEIASPAGFRGMRIWRRLK